MLETHQPSFTHPRERHHDYLERRAAPADPSLPVIHTKAPVKHLGVPSPAQPSSLRASEPSHSMPCGAEKSISQALPKFQPTELRCSMWWCFKALSLGVVWCTALDNQHSKINNDFHRNPVRFLLTIKSGKVTKALQRRYCSVYSGWYLLTARSQSEPMDLHFYVIAYSC